MLFFLMFFYLFDVLNIMLDDLSRTEMGLSTSGLVN